MTMQQMLVGMGGPVDDTSLDGIGANLGNKTLGKFRIC